ncbi:hypothetical protein C8A01DRAFT_44183 [Parachaetomium inaequale]|uniref:Uncharacterized protein n=1 Tax=Parachaetomium inaequale TaxID=2588326 RepID=A0AAN6PMM8_9PEZI|nr:hypothetical protein C8A01DRAFT_44183 [Parachaetomium inaequale]
MEREEHTLRRQCEDLRLTLENRTRELSQSQELYSKLKQRVLLGQTQEAPPSVSRSRTPLRAHGTADAGYRDAQSQLPRPAMPVGVKTGVSNYFPASPGFSKTQPSSTAPAEWNKPTLSQQTEMPATPSRNVPLGNPRSLAFASTPRTGVGTAVPVPASGRFQQTASTSHINATDGPRVFSGPKLGVTGIRRSLGGGDLDVPRHSLGRTEGVPRESPHSTARRPSQHFEPPGPILRRP